MANVTLDSVKAVVAGDLITARAPYQQTMQFRPYAKHFLAMNQFPALDDQSHGMMRRIYIVDFPRRFSEDEMDVDLREKLVSELPGIFNWALEGYERLIDKRFRFQKVQSMEKSKQTYQAEMNTVLAFARECLVKTDNADDRLKFGEVYDAYVSFCSNEVHEKQENKIQFRKLLLEAGYSINKSTRDANQVYMEEVKYSS